MIQFQVFLRKLHLLKFLTALIHTKETKLNVTMHRVSPGIPSPVSEDTPTASVSDSTDHIFSRHPHCVMLVYLQEH